MFRGEGGHVVGTQPGPKDTKGSTDWFQVSSPTEKAVRCSEEDIHMRSDSTFPSHPFATQWPPARAARATWTVHSEAFFPSSPVTEASPVRRSCTPSDLVPTLSSLRGMCVCQVPHPEQKKTPPCWQTGRCSPS